MDLLLNTVNEIFVAIQNSSWCGSVYAVLTVVHKATSQITVTHLCLTLCSGSFPGFSVTCPEFPTAINILLSELDCNQCSVIMSWMRETIIIYLMVFMCKLNKAKEYSFFSTQISGILKSCWAFSWSSLLQSVSFIAWWNSVVCHISLRIRGGAALDSPKSCNFVCCKVIICKIVTFSPSPGSQLCIRVVSWCSKFWSFYILLLTSLFNHDEMYIIQENVKENHSLIISKSYSHYILI